MVGQGADKSAQGTPHVWGRIGSTFLLLIPLSACLVIPGNERPPVQPQLEGVVFEGGAPASGRALRASFSSRERDCKVVGDVVHTDAAGRFSITPRLHPSGTRVITLAPSSPTFFIAVCLADSDGQTLLFAQRYYGAPPPLINLQCEIDQSAGEGGYCTVAMPRGSQWP